MKNKEKFANEIINLAINNKVIAVNKYTNDVVDCYMLPCIDCLFHGKCGCDPLKTTEWANSEYKEPKRFTSLERDFAITCDKVKYYARDKDGEVWGYNDKPTKCTLGWGLLSSNNVVRTKISRVSSLKFEAIKWEDDQPTTREEIIKSKI